ncbi:hypothetical protein BDP55DRAFT_649614 [Colletotrichum godetiae]|uniref:Uncharacterized protein n=1 Tax=Colletotrichum godetiae TaxID=1209918 RepID=A0AAJ0AVG3_9PEZI|nr:uncharacterized protein BDP55DRAFT_649614 [Colletotrichum godetiae]KAK1691116.1 hypothetical protein BDP55DRAFT_649614 [Colletotrichum godetiae]
MTPALPYSTQSDQGQQQSTPEETDWSESELNERRTSYRHHQRNTKPLDNFEDTASRLGWDGTHPDPDSYSSYQEARFTTGQAVPYRRGYLEDFADPLQRRGHPKRNPLPQHSGPNDPQRFDQHPKIPTMNYHGVPHYPGTYPMYAPPMRFHPPVPHHGGWRNSMGGPRAMRPPPPPIDPYGPYYVPHPEPIHPHPYDALPHIHALTGPRKQPFFPIRRKDHRTQYAAPQESFEGYYADTTALEPKKQPKPRQNKALKQTTEPTCDQECWNAVEDLYKRLDDRDVKEKARREKEKQRAAATALKASLARQVQRTMRKELDRANAQLRDIDLRSESSRRILRSDIGSRVFATPVPSVHDDRDSEPLVRSTVIETLRELKIPSQLDLGGYHTPDRPSHRRAVSDVHLSGGYRPLPRHWNTAPTTSSNLFISNQPSFGQPSQQEVDLQQGRDEAFWAGRPPTSKKARQRRERTFVPEIQRDMNAPLWGGLSPGDSGYGSPGPLRPERPRSGFRTRKVSFEDNGGTSRPRREDLRGDEAGIWPEDESDAPVYLQKRPQRYPTTVPHPLFDITVVHPPVPQPERYLENRGL